MTPVAERRTDTHELFNTDAAHAYVEKARRIKEAQAGHAHDAVPVEAAE